MTDRWIESKEEEEKARVLQKENEEKKQKEEEEERRKPSVCVSRFLSIIIVQTSTAEYCGVFFIYYWIFRKYLAATRHLEHERLVQSQLTVVTPTVPKKRRPVPKILISSLSASETECR